MNLIANKKKVIYFNHKSSHFIIISKIKTSE